MNVWKYRFIPDLHVLVSKYVWRKVEAQRQSDLFLSHPSSSLGPTQRTSICRRSPALLQSCSSLYRHTYDMTLTTPRRSTRGAIFTPSPHANHTYTQPNTTYTWTSAPVTETHTGGGATTGSLSLLLTPQPLATTSTAGEGSSSRRTQHNPRASTLRQSQSGTDPGGGLTGPRTYYTSFTRIVHRSSKSTQPKLSVNGTPRKPKAAKGDEESRFHVGDGVMVGVDGGDGVGILVGLYEEEVKRKGRMRRRGSGSEGDSGEESSGSESDSQSQSDGREGSDDDGSKGEGARERRSKKRMMAVVHWCFRRKDLPGVMKNLSVEDVSAVCILLFGGDKECQTEVRMRCFWRHPQFDQR